MHCAKNISKPYEQIDRKSLGKDISFLRCMILQLIHLSLCEFVSSLQVSVSATPTVLKIATTRTTEAGTGGVLNKLIQPKTLFTTSKMFIITIKLFCINHCYFAPVLPIYYSYFMQVFSISYYSYFILHW